MTTEVEDKVPFGTLPFLDVIASRRAGRERVFGGVDSERTNRLLVVRQGDARLACCKIPEPI